MYMETQCYSCNNCDKHIKGGLMIDRWMKEIKKGCDPRALGMILAHNGIVRTENR